MPSREDYALNFARDAAATISVLGMAGITLLQALHNKSLVIVAEIGMPAELGVASVFGRLAINNARAFLHEPIPGMYEPSLVPEKIPDTQTLARQIGLGG